MCEQSADVCIFFKGVDEADVPDLYSTSQCRITVQESDRDIVAAMSLWQLRHLSKKRLSRQKPWYISKLFAEHLPHPPSYHIVLIASSIMHIGRDTRSGVHVKSASREMVNLPKDLNGGATTL